MKVRKVIDEVIDHKSGDVNVAGAVHGIVAANVDEPGEHSVKVTSRTRIVQRNGRTEHAEHTTTTEHDDEEEST